MPTDGRTLLGKQAEDLACRALARQGYAILARRFRTRFGELDIIARDGPTLVFVEVRARCLGGAGHFSGTPLESVTPRKRWKLSAMAAEYVLRRGVRPEPCRFDVVGVTFGESEQPRIEIVKAAFDSEWGF